jgi:hypothetical protein
VGTLFDDGPTEIDFGAQPFVHRGTGWRSRGGGRQQGVRFLALFKMTVGPGVQHPSTVRNTKKTHRFATGEPGVKVGILREKVRPPTRSQRLPRLSDSRTLRCVVSNVERMRQVFDFYVRVFDR